MHVLFLPSWYPESPGDISGSFFREQALALSNSGCKVGVIHPNIRSLKHWRACLASNTGFSQQNDSGVPTFRFNGVNWFPKVRILSARFTLKMGYALYEQYVKEHGHPDVIHVHSMLNAGLVAQYINAQHRIPFIITEHSSAFARKSLTAGQLLLCRGIANRAVRRFAVSFPFCHLLAEVLGDNGMKWEEMPNIVSEEFLTLPFAPSTDDTGIFKFVTVCLLTQKKGTHILLQAFAQVFRNDPFVTLDIGGDGPERSKLESLAHALGIRNQVRFVGMLSRSQVMDTMAGADAFVLASFYETFGVVFVEALALGKPVIATRCGGPESIVRSEDGLLVPANDVEALGEAMKKMRSKSGSYQRDVIRANCADRYGQASIIKRLSKVYEDVSHNVSRA